MRAGESGGGYLLPFMAASRAASSAVERASSCMASSIERQPLPPWATGLMSWSMRELKASCRPLRGGDVDGVPLLGLISIGLVLEIRRLGFGEQLAEFLGLELRDRASLRAPSCRPAVIFPAIDLRVDGQGAQRSWLGSRPW